MEPVAAGVISTWLPAQTAPIQLTWGDTTTGAVGEIGQIVSQRVKNEAGQAASVQGAAAMAAFQLERLEVAHTAGSRWADPDMRRWEADSGTTGPFAWSA